jgi:hypothetical protein
VLAASQADSAGSIPVTRSSRVIRGCDPVSNKSVARFPVIAVSPCPLRARWLMSGFDSPAAGISEHLISPLTFTFGEAAHWS